MKYETIIARDLPDAWFQCVYKLLETGHEYIIDRGSYKGQKRLEFDYVTVHIKYPSTRPLLPDIPPNLGIPNPVSPDYLDQYLPYLMTSVRQPGEEYTYGQYLEPQINEVIRMYREEGHGTNQAYMLIGDQQSIYLDDPPCLRGIDTRIKEGKLHFFVYFRSWDLWNGFPANLGAIQMLKEYMASEIGVEDGEIIAASKGLHLYDYAWDLARLRTGKTEEFVNCSECDWYIKVGKSKKNQAFHDFCCCPEVSDSTVNSQWRKCAFFKKKDDYEYI